MLSDSWNYVQKSFVRHLEAGHFFCLVEFSTKTRYARCNSSTTLGPVNMYPNRLHTTDRLNVYSPSNYVIWQL